MQQIDDPAAADVRAARESTSAGLIASDKVEGTAVYARDGSRLGSIETLMLDKRSGQVAYAVLSFGGFLGIGDEYRPLPWRTLEYDPQAGGYVVDIDPDTLHGAPAYARGAVPAWDDREWGSRIDDYYHVPPYWA